MEGRKRVNPFMKRISSICLLIWISSAIASNAQTSLRHANCSDPQHNKKELRNCFDLLLARVAKVPPEYKADIGFTIVDLASPSLLSPERRLSLLRDIARSSGAARRPTMVRYAAAFRDGEPLSEMETKQVAFNKLDTLDISARALDRSLASAPKLSQKIFDGMSPKASRSSCNNPTVEDVAAFYVSAEKILNESRIHSISGQDKFKYLENLVAHMDAPEQIGPLASLLADLPLTGVQLQDLADRFILSINSITASDREMVALTENGQITEAIRNFSYKLIQSKNSASSTLSAYRSFLLRSLTHEACADRTSDRDTVAAEFNSLPDVAPLSKEELSAHFKGRMAADELPLTDMDAWAAIRTISKQRRNALAENYRYGGAVLDTNESPAEKEAVNYAVFPRHFDNQCPACEFVEQTGVFMALTSCLPKGSNLQRVVDAEVNLLSLNAIEHNDPVIWITPFKELLNLGRTRNAQPDADMKAAIMSDGGIWEAPSTGAIEIRQMLRRSSDPIIATYVLTDDVLDSPYLTPTQQLNAK
jgi:hypothetical protein